MAQRTQVILTCDVHDGNAEAVETVEFTVEGQTFQCELCEAHLAEFRDAMEIWSSNSRQAGRARGGPSSGSARGGRRSSSSSSSSGSEGPSTADVRQWARSEGIAVSDRGRVPAELHARYLAAH